MLIKTMLKFIAIAIIFCLGILPSKVLAQPKLRWKKKGSGKLGLCEGDCDRSSDCEVGLSCFKRDELEVVPGCMGFGRAGRDYCYVAASSVTRPLTNKVTDSTRKGTDDKDDEVKERTKKVTENKDDKDDEESKVSKIEHIGTSQAYVKGSDVYRAKIKVPAGTMKGDLLILVLHRTDDFLPVDINGDELSGWRRAGECFKSNNGRPCATYMDCKFCAPEENLVDTKNVFCEKFSKDGQFGRKTDGSGKDLAQAIFYKEAGRDELGRGKKTLKLALSPWPERDHPAWMFLTTLRGADTKDPIRDWMGTGNDNSTYSVFPSIYGKEGDLHLLSQGFDSGAPGVREGDFLPPRGYDDFASMFDCDNPKSRESRAEKCDESGYLFGKVLRKSGNTGEKTTRGNGRWMKSDGLVSMIIMPAGGSKDSRGRGASEWLGTKGKDCPKDRRKPKP